MRPARLGSISLAAAAGFRELKPPVCLCLGRGAEAPSNPKQRQRQQQDGIGKSFLQRVALPA